MKVNIRTSNNKININYDYKDYMITFHTTDNISNYSITTIDYEPIFKSIIKIGELINKYIDVENKTPLYTCNNKSGGKKEIIDVLYDENINNTLLDKIVKNTSDFNKLKDNLSQILSIFRYSYYNTNKIVPHEVTYYLKRYYFIYEIYNFITSIKNKKYPESKLWNFEDSKFKFLSIDELFFIVQKLYNSRFDINIHLSYDVDSNQPIQVYENEYDIAINYLIPNFTSITASKRLVKNTYCQLCGNLMINEGYKYCNNCKTKAKTINKRNERLKNTTKK